VEHVEGGRDHDFLGREDRPRCVEGDLGVIMDTLEGEFVALSQGSPIRVFDLTGRRLALFHHRRPQFCIPRNGFEEGKEVFLLKFEYPHFAFPLAGRPFFLTLGGKTGSRDEFVAMKMADVKHRAFIMQFPCRILILEAKKYRLITS
jgi:hypothetical protein